MSLRRVESFSADAELNRRLKEFQSNVGKAVDDLENIDRLRVVRVRASGYITRPGELAIVTGSLELLLATPIPEYEGRHLIVIVQLGTVKIRPVSTVINGTAFVSYGATSMVQIYCADGKYYIQ